MVEADPDWNENNNESDGADWGDWDEAQLHFEQPDLTRKGSSFQ